MRVMMEEKRREQVWDGRQNDGPGDQQRLVEAHSVQQRAKRLEFYSKTYKTIKVDL